MIEQGFVYSIFGLNVRCNLGIPGIASIRILHAVSPVPGSFSFTDQNVQIYLSPSPHGFESVPRGSEEPGYTSAYKDSSGEPALRIWKINGGQFLRLEYFDGTQFWLDREGTSIWATWPENLTLEDTATYLLGPVLGLLLRLRGVTCIHGSAVSFGDCAVAFAGPEGAGKSTTAAALAREGCAIVSDDVVALQEVDGCFHIHPAYPYLCLWPESVEAIYGNADALPRFSRNFEKRCLSLEKQNLRFEARSLPLRVIYVLGERRPDPAPIIETISAQKSILALVANTFATNILDSAMRAKEFESLGRLLRHVRVREVFAHEDPGRLADLCRLIREDAEGMDAGISGLHDAGVANE